MKDILIFMSDQHDARVSGYAGDSVVRTPNLDRLAEEGTVFDSAYTSCPLCVPARMSMLCGLLPSRTALFDNAGSIPSEQSTFLHALGAAGYETVLCGRMHFEGPDQRHGFAKRICGDMTPVYFGYRKNIPAERQLYGMCYAEPGSLKIIGGGTSPVLEYDRAVTRAALEYLHKPHEKPQCIVVGTYSPHFPYVAPPELYDYYLDKVKMPVSQSDCDYSHPAYQNRTRCSDPAVVRAARAAYWGMVEFMDGLLGEVHAAWREYLARQGREGVFCYLSDHGDQAGERGLYGKTTFFEGSAHIPLLFSGSGIPRGRRIAENVSIMDLGPTLCEMTGAPALPRRDGVSLWRQIQGEEEDGGRCVISELLEPKTPSSPAAIGEKIPGRMVVWKQYKYITYLGLEADDLLFDLKADPLERHNLAKERPDLLPKLRQMAHRDWDTAEIMERYYRRCEEMRVQFLWAQKQDLSEEDRWKCPPEVLRYPQNLVSADIPVSPVFQRIAGRMQADGMDAETFLKQRRINQ